MLPECAWRAFQEGRGEPYRRAIKAGIDAYQKVRESAEMAQTKTESPENWAKQEQQKLDAEREKAYAEKGYKPLFRLERGENSLEFTNPLEPPRKYEGEYGVRMMFSVRAGDKEFDLSINPRSPLYREIVTAIATGKKRVIILREGEGKNVRDSIKQAQ